jgi:hypothetical protein
MIEINNCEETVSESMPYSSPYNNASSNLRAAIIVTFFEDTPRVPAPTPRPETPIIFQCHLARPQICTTRDQSEATQPKEDSSARAMGEIYSAYATPEGSPRLTFSFYLELTDFPSDHRPHGGEGRTYEVGGAATEAEIWGENNDWTIRRVSQAAQTD